MAVTTSQNKQDQQMGETVEVVPEIDEQIVTGEDKSISRKISDDKVTMGTEKMEARKRRFNVKLSEYDVSTNRRKLSKRIVDNVVITEDQSHQQAKRLVKSALRGCQVTLRNCKVNLEDDENHNHKLQMSEDAGSVHGSSSFKSSSQRSQVCSPEGPELGSNLSNYIKSGEGTFLKPELKVIKISKTLSNTDGRNDDLESANRSDEHASDWFDGNRFTCQKCMFTSTSLDSFTEHVKRSHKTTLAKFSGCYTKTAVQYQCKFCRKEVYHERSVLKEHVETHLLSLDKYAIMYEKKSSRKEVAIPKIHKKSPFFVDHLLPPFQKDPSLATNPAFQPRSKDLSPALRPTQFEENQSPALLTLSSPPPKILTSPNSTDIVDKFVYVCPFAGCDFQTDLSGMKCGPAAEHGIAGHQVGPWELKNRGLKWKRVLRSKRMGRGMV
jgi:hypothetical protein